MFDTMSQEHEDKKTGGKYVEIEVSRWGFNGSSFGLTAKTLRINEFPGRRKIIELDFFPLKYLREQDKL